MVKLAFILFTNLSVGAGTENIILQYCKNAPPQFEITIVQTDHPDGKFKYDERCFAGKNLKLLTIKGYDYKFAFFNKSPFGKALYLFFIQPILFFTLRFTLYAGIQKKIGDQDIIYVVQNHYSVLFKRGPIIIGNTQCWNPIKSGPKSIFTKIVANRMFWRRIDYFHVFEHYSFFLSQRRGFVLPNGVDTSIFSPARKDKSKKDFIFIGRLEVCKGVKIAVDAFKILGSDNVSLNIIGEGSLSGLLESGNNIRYYGYVNHKEMAVILGKVGCLVYPSTCDTFSLVVIEALASGLYVIASSYLRGIFDEFQAIGVLEYCNPTSSEMSKRMKAFLTREIDIYAFEKARQLIMEKYSWNSISGLLYDYFISFVKMGDQVAKN